MKKIITFVVLIITSVYAAACPVCDRNDTKEFKLINTHGAEPESSWDYLIVIAITILAIVTLFYTIKWLRKPNEKNNDHIKYQFLN